MYYEFDGTPTEWKNCICCGKSSQFERFSVANYFAPDRNPADPVEAFCRKHFPAGPATFDDAVGLSFRSSVLHDF